MDCRIVSTFDHYKPTKWATDSDEEYRTKCNRHYFEYSAAVDATVTEIRDRLMKAVERYKQVKNPNERPDPVVVWNFQRELRPHLPANSDLVMADGGRGDFQNFNQFNEYALEYASIVKNVLGKNVTTLIRKQEVALPARAKKKPAGMGQRLLSNIWYVFYCCIQRVRAPTHEMNSIITFRVKPDSPWLKERDTLRIARDRLPPYQELFRLQDATKVQLKERIKCLGPVSDFGIQLGELVVPVSKRCLVDKSPLMRTMLLSGFKEGTEKTMKVEGDHKAWLRLIDFLHGTAVNIDTAEDVEEVIELAKLAHQYQVWDLFDSCIEDFRKQLAQKEMPLTSDTVNLILDISDLFEDGDGPLRSACEAYIKDNKLEQHVTRIRLTPGLGLTTGLHRVNKSVNKGKKKPPADSKESKSDSKDSKDGKYPTSGATVNLSASAIVGQGPLGSLDEDEEDNTLSLSPSNEAGPAVAGEEAHEAAQGERDATDGDAALAAATQAEYWTEPE